MKSATNSKLIKKISLLGLTISYNYLFYYVLLLNTTYEFSNLIGVRKILVPTDYQIYLLIIINSLISLLLPTSSKPSTLLLWFLYLSHFLSTIYANSILFDYYSLYIVIWIEFTLLIFVFLLIPNLNISTIIYKIKNFNVKILNIRYYLLILNLLIAASILIIYFNFGLDIKLKNIYAVYDVRSEFKESLKNFNNPLIYYLISNSAFALAPISILIALENRNHIIIFHVTLFFVLLLAFVIFQNSGFKSVAFTPITIILLYFLSKFYRKSIFNFLALLIIVFLIVYYLSDFFDFYKFLFYHSFRRIFLSSGFNVVYFYDLIKFDIGIIYDNTIPIKVSLFYYGTDGSANTGFLGDSFAKFYPYGLFLSYIIIVFFAKVMDAFTQFLSKSVLYPVVLLYGYLFSNSSSFTILFTYGLILTLILLFVYYLISRPLKTIQTPDCQ